MMPELQGINPVILDWLTQYNKRKVQDMAGHKYISSTETYVQQEWAPRQINWLSITLLDDFRITII